MKEVEWEVTYSLYPLSPLFQEISEFLVFVYFILVGNLETFSGFFWYGRLESFAEMKDNCCLMTE